MIDMPVSEALRMKRKLEAEMVKLIRDFEQITGLEINGWRMERIQSLGSKSDVVAVALEVTL